MNAYFISYLKTTKNEQTVYILKQTKYVMEPGIKKYRWSVDKSIIACLFCKFDMSFEALQ